VRDGNVGRFGGDEFLVGLPGCDEATTEKRARDIVARLTADPVSTSTGEIRISISYGTAVNLDPAHLDSLIETADQDLYQRKRKRRKLAFPSPS
jgi:diguanylate cyclase (GGDEF)-like protein